MTYACNCRTRVRWVRAGVAAGLASMAMVKLRMRTTDFLDAQEQAAALSALETLALALGD